MSTVAASGFTIEAFEAFLAARHEPSWLVERRRAAWKLFEKLPMPSRADEEWMRTDIRLFRLDRFGFPAETSPATFPDALLKQGVDLAGYTVALDSSLAATEIDPSLAKSFFGLLPRDYANISVQNPPFRRSGRSHSRR